MNDLVFDSKGWNDYLYWQMQDRRTLKKINGLLDDIRRNGALQGIGKPEALRHGAAGLYSRRIDAANRLVYGIDEGKNIRIISCRGHYED